MQSMAADANTEVLFMLMKLSIMLKSKLCLWLVSSNPSMKRRLWIWVFRNAPNNEHHPDLIDELKPSTSS